MSRISAPSDKRFRRVHVKPARRRGLWRRVLKPVAKYSFLSMVAAAILVALGVADRLREQRAALTDAERRAQTDPLTGVLNRRSLIERLDAACLRARARGLPIALLFIDLDQARQLIGAWVIDYNTARPHSSLGYKTPTAYAGTLIAPKGVTLAKALTAAG